MKNRTRMLSVFGLVWTFLAAAPTAQQAAQFQQPPGPPVRTITLVRGDLYKVQSGAGVAAVWPPAFPASL